jgi:hypothetical protein
MVMVFSIISLTVIVGITAQAGEARQIKAIVVKEPGSSDKSEIATAKAETSGTSLHIILSETNKWMGRPGSKEVYPNTMHVRYFDKDGNYLGHFKSSELFIPKWISDSENIRVLLYPGQKSTPFGKDTKLSYSINARDISFIEIVELSFSAGEYEPPVRESGYPIMTK